MAVNKRKDRNTWYFDVSYTKLDGTPDRERQSGFLTQKAAKQAEAEFLTTIHEQNDNKYLTIKELCETFLDTKKGTVTSTTYKSINIIISKHIIPYFNEQKVLNLSHKMILRWQNELAAKGYSNQRINDVTKKFREIIRFADSVYNISINPFKAIGKLKEEEREEVKVYDLNTFNKYISVVKDKEHYTYFNFMFWSGLRPGESWALTWNDINFINKTVSVTKTCIQVRKELAIV